MIGRSLARRLEDLESHIQSAGEPVVIRVEFVDAKGEPLWITRTSR